MGTERIILCGGAKPTAGTSTSHALKLDLWKRGKGFEVTLEIEDMNRRLGAAVARMARLSGVLEAAQTLP